jgi:undecaprenyl-diphosphatase
MAATTSPTPDAAPSAVDGVTPALRATASVATQRAAEALGSGAAKLAQPPTGRSASVTVPSRTALRRTRWTELAIVAALGAFGVLFAMVRAGRSAAFDVALTLRLQRRRHPLLGRLLRAVSWPGFPPQSRIIPPAIISSLWLLGLRFEALFQVVAWSSALLSTVIKAFVRRPRPAGSGIEVVVAPLGGSSFPSGHVLTYIGVYGFLAHVVHALVRPALPRRILVGGLTALLALVGPSRIAQGHHWPTDVLASYLVGLPFLAAVIELYRRSKGRALDPRRGAR